jgi:methyl-CpG-binding domain protein 4
MELLQERFWQGDPWRVLVICILLNRTERHQVEKILPDLFKKWPTAKAMADTPLHAIEEFIAVLGLRNRAIYLNCMSSEIAYGADWTPITHHLSGCGQYAQEAWRMIVEKDRSFIPQDGELRKRMGELIERGE